MAAFSTPVDVANRGLQIIGVPRIVAFTDSSKAAKETNFAIDMLRQAELRRSVWTFATRRTVLRPIVSTSEGITFLLYNAATTYAAGDVVADTVGFLWISLRGTNIGNTPGLAEVIPFWTSYFGPTIAQVWTTAVAYFPGDMVYVTGTPNVIYICVAANTTQTPPNASFWHVVAGAVSSALVQLSPLGVNPPTGATTRNLYRLPANYIRLAPQDPKAAANVRQSTLAGMMFNDWEIENGYLFTADVSPIIFRFVADLSDVPSMDPMFCEAWAARVSVEACVTLTQSVEKLNTAIGHYERQITMAKMLNAIEEGSTEPELPEGGGGAPQGQPAPRGQ